MSKDELGRRIDMVYDRYMRKTVSKVLASLFVVSLCTLGLVCFLTVLTSSPGCVSKTDTQEQAEQAEYSQRSSNVTYVCVGMETSKRFGKCSGCKLDSDRMNAMLGRTFGYAGVLLQDGAATRWAVADAIRNAVKSVDANGLFILYYSGHGGRELLKGTGFAVETTEPEGADEEDEYLCLYDSYLLDDEVWALVSKCRGRVFMVFDCCHSQTMFRSVSSDVALSRGYAIPLEEPKMVKSAGFGAKMRSYADSAVPLGLESQKLRMLCWSGCAESEYSFGSSSGGVMTNGLLLGWRSGIGYSALWDYIVSYVSARQPTQHPQITEDGFYSDGGSEEAFK